MSYKVLKDRLLVKRKDLVTTSAGGIALLEIGQELPDQGAVIAVGPGRLAADGSRIPMEVAVGDQVIFGKTSGVAMKLNGADYVVLREDELFAVLEE